MRVATSDGDLYVHVTGSGPPLLMLHGWPLDHRAFRPQLDALADAFQLIAPDRRGFGRSAAPPDLRRELDDVDCIIGALGLRDVHLLGMSQGGRIALRYAVTHPERLRSLVLQGAVIDGFNADEAPAERVPTADYSKLAKTGRLEEARQRWLQHPMMRLHGQAAGAARLLRDILAGYSGADLLAFEPDSYGFEMDVLGALERLDLPVLVITGALETGARKQHAAEIVARIPGAREIVLPGCGHLSNLESPDVYIGAVRDFCETVDSAAAAQEASLLME